MLNINIRFDWSMIIGFFCGVVVGIIILFLIYLLYVLVNIKKQNKLVKLKDNISEEDAIKRINMTKLAFKEKKTKGIKSINYTYELCSKLLVDTALDFYPDSKHPIFELSLNEILELSEYIKMRMDSIFNYKGLKFLKNLKVATILNLTDTKRVIEENEIIKATKRYKLKSAYQAAKKVINLINPLWWAKKLVIDGTFNILINKLCLVLIAIVGEETYKIYSKKVFLEMHEIDASSEEIKDLEVDLNEE